MKNIMKLLEEKKDEKEMSEKDIQAKKEVLKELINMAIGAAGKKFGSDMEEMQKVTVASPNKEGLVEGLEKAKELTKEMPEMVEEEVSEDEEELEDDEMSEEEMVNEEDEDEEENKKKRKMMY